MSTNERIVASWMAQDDASLCASVAEDPSIAISVKVEIQRLRARNAATEDLLEQARAILALCSTRTFEVEPEDRLVRELREREDIGFGAIMSAASKEWAASNARKGVPEGSHFTCGPCESTVKSMIAIIDEHLSLLPETIKEGP